MKYLHLIWAALFRRKTRTILTLRVDHRGVPACSACSTRCASRLPRRASPRMARSACRPARRLSFIQTLPQSLGAQIATVDGRQGCGLRQLVRRRLSGSAQSDFHLRGQSRTISTCIRRSHVAPDAAQGVTTTRPTASWSARSSPRNTAGRSATRFRCNRTIFPNRDGSKNWTFRSRRHRAFQRRQEHVPRPDVPHALEVLRRDSTPLQPTAWWAGTSAASTT